MAEYIEREAAVKSIMQKERHDFPTDYFPDDEYAFNDGLVVAANALDEVRAADVVPLIHATWETDTCHFYCSECEQYVDYKTNYCPNCGALMDKDGDGE